MNDWIQNCNTTCYLIVFYTAGSNESWFVVLENVVSIDSHVLASALFKLHGQQWENLNIDLDFEVSKAGDLAYWESRCNKSHVASCGSYLQGCMWTIVDRPVPFKGQLDEAQSSNHAVFSLFADVYSHRQVGEGSKLEFFEEYIFTEFKVQLKNIFEGKDAAYDVRELLMQQAWAKEELKRIRDEVKQEEKRRGGGTRLSRMRRGLVGGERAAED